jgi:hypothetical protein
MITPMVSIQRRNMDKNTSGSRALSVSSKLISNLYELYMNNQIVVNRRYQRKLVWTLEEKQKLIQSILDSYPIPAVILNKINNGTYEVIDGLQRLNAVMAFAEQEFPTLDGEYFEIEQMQYAKLRSIEGVFEAKDKETEKIMSLQSASKFPTYAMSVLEISNASEDEIDEIFRRINTYGHQLSNQERRQAGVQGEFPDFVREIADTIRLGEVSSPKILLNNMSEISIGTSTKTQKSINPNDIFWVKHGIIPANKMRQSDDEEILARIIGSIITRGEMIPGEKEAIDKVYSNSKLYNESLKEYGAKRVWDEVLFCIDQINKIVDECNARFLKNLIYSKNSQKNPYSSRFVILFVALHAAFFEEAPKNIRKINDYKSVGALIERMFELVDHRKKTKEGISQSVEKMFIEFKKYMIDEEHPENIYNIDGYEIEAILKNSSHEDTRIDFKQGLASLGHKTSKKQVHANMNKILETACAIANSGHTESGYILVGIAEDKDVNRIKDLYPDIQPKKINGRYVVGVSRELNQIEGLDWKNSENNPEYIRFWKEFIKNSNLSEDLKSSLLNKIRYRDYYGLGVLVVEIEPQDGISTIKNTVYVRNGDSVESFEYSAENHKKINQILRRFDNK